VSLASFRDWLPGGRKPRPDGLSAALRVTRELGECLLTDLDCSSSTGHDGAAPGGNLDPSTNEITELLQAWSEGDLDARDRLVPLVYQELRRRAAAHLRRERPGHTLQPTALVHEAYLRLVDQDRAAWQNRAQFLAVASQMMRRILVDRARARRMAKRSGGWTRVTLGDAIGVTHPIDVDVLDLDDALTRLAAFDARKTQIAELRFFAGLSLDEIGRALGISLATVERDWQAARAWLFKELSGQQVHDA
jgi:RNA polymerase sigma factor (TIGR02999 family)